MDVKLDAVDAVTLDALLKRIQDGVCAVNELVSIAK